MEPMEFIGADLQQILGINKVDAVRKTDELRNRLNAVQNTKSHCESYLRIEDKKLSDSAGKHGISLDAVLEGWKDESAMIDQLQEKARMNPEGRQNTILAVKSEQFDREQRLRESAESHSVQYTPLMDFMRESRDSYCIISYFSKEITRSEEQIVKIAEFYAPLNKMSSTYLVQDAARANCQYNLLQVVEKELKKLPVPLARNDEQKKAFLQIEEDMRALKFTEEDMQPFLQTEEEKLRERLLSQRKSIEDTMLQTNFGLGVKKERCTNGDRCSGLVYHGENDFFHVKWEICLDCLDTKVYQKI